jgi:replicative DNA helicase
LCIIGAGPKTGKSFWLLWAAYCHWRAGGVPVLFTLENSVEMTLTRLACMACAIDSRRWDRGQCTPEEIQRVTEWVAYLLAHERPFHILQPEPGKRTVESMVRRARTLGDSIFIDQLTFVEVSKGSERKARHEQIRDMLHELKALISSGKRMPAILAHQINREGVKAAEKTGFVEMYHMAESSEVERTADWVFGLYQGTAMRDGLRAYIQILAARRADLLNWEAIWAPYVGRFEIRTTVTLGQQGTTP